MATLDEIESAFAHAGKPPLPQRLVRADLREIELTHWEGQYRKDIQQSDAAAWLTLRIHADIWHLGCRGTHVDACVDAWGLCMF